MRSFTFFLYIIVSIHWDSIVMENRGPRQAGTGRGEHGSWDWKVDVQTSPGNAGDSGPGQYGVQECPKAC